MKILRVIRTIDVHGGGPIEGVRQLNAAWRQMGHEVAIASLDAPGGSIEGEQHFALGPGRGNYGFRPTFTAELREVARQFDVVTVEGIWQQHSCGTRKALAGLPQPYYVFPHGMLDPWFKHTYRLKHLKKIPYWWFLEYPVLRDAKAVFFTTEEERIQAAKSFTPYKVSPVVSGYGIHKPSSDAGQDRKAFFDRFPELIGQSFLLFLGRIHEKKGCDLLIEAFAKVFADSNTYLMMAGPDQVGWASRLQQLAAQRGVANRVLWPGMLSGAVKWGALRVTEAFVLPSHQENFGVAVAEALSVGTPVLLSDKVNIWREIVAGAAGIVASDTAIGTEALLRQWLSMSTVDRYEMRLAASRCFMASFEVNAVAHHLLNIFQAGCLARP